MATRTLTNMIGPCTRAAMLAFAVSSAPSMSGAQEAAGTITLSRDIPARDAFRPGAPGPVHQVATAREDVVIANTRALESSVGSMPGLGQHSLASGIGTLGSQIPAAITRAAPDAHLARASAATVGGVSEVLSAGSLGGSLNSFASTLSSTMRGR